MNSVSSAIEPLTGDPELRKENTLRLVNCQRWSHEIWLVRCWAHNMICRTIAIKTCVVRWLREGFKLILQSDKAHESIVSDLFSEFAFIILHWQRKLVVTWGVLETHKPNIEELKTSKRFGVAFAFQLEFCRNWLMWSQCHRPHYNFWALIVAEISLS